MGVDLEDSESKTEFLTLKNLEKHGLLQFEFYINENFDF